jgi:nucleoside-diphosphate-sugar epimerase
MSRVLITGGCGFLGRRLVKAALAAGHHVFTLDNFEPTCGADCTGVPDAPNYVWNNVDITDQPKLYEAIKAIKPDVIIHLAAYGRNLNCRDYADRATHVNVGGTFNILEAAHLLNVPRVVVCSSNITLSDQDTVYKRTKLATEHLVWVFSDTFGLSVMGLRPSNIYGEGQSRTEYQKCAFAGMDTYFEENGHFLISGDGTQDRDFTHADDVADAFLLAADSAVSGCTLDIATGVQTSMNEVAQLLGVDVKYTDPRPGDAKTLVSNIEPAKALLGFTAKRKLADHIFEAFPAVYAHQLGATIAEAHHQSFWTDGANV